MNQTLINEMLHLEARRGDTKDEFHYVRSFGNDLDGLLVLVYEQIDGRVEPNTNTRRRRRWAAMSTVERIQRSDESLSYHLLAEDRVPAAKEEE